MFERILVVLGSLSRTGSSIPYVRYLANNFGAEIYLLGVSTETRPVREKSLLGSLESISRTLQAEKIAVKTDFIHGNPAVEVVKYCNNNNITLIATSAGADNEITCPILCNVSRRMGLDLSTPILTVPPQTSREFNVLEDTRVINLLVPLDRSTVSETALPYVETIASKLNCRVTLLNVNTPPVRGVPVLNTEVVKISHASGTSYLKKMCGHIRQKKINSDYYVVDGPVVKTILNQARAGKYHMIVMATHGSTGIGWWERSSITKKVSEKAEIPVLAVCSPATGISPLLTAQFTGNNNV